MGKAKYVLRLDDISYDMNIDKFNHFREILERNNIKPLIGVIPFNENLSLKKHGNSKRIKAESFWHMLKRLSQECGWTIALHGYNHVYTTREAGILKVNSRSEFAGLEEEEQKCKILKGKKIVEEKELIITAFMPPAHSFDHTTVKVLVENGITIMTDGYGLYTYQKWGVTFVPQLFARPRKMPFGIYTFCFHTNSMTEEDFIKAERFIVKNKEDIISFTEAVQIEADTTGKKLINIIVSYCFYIRASFRLILRKLS